ncbi:hypothetical protein ACFXTH_044436 [Malus domestica]
MATVSAPARYKLVFLGDQSVGSERWDSGPSRLGKSRVHLPHFSPSIATRSSIASCLRSSSPKVFQGLMSWAWVRRLVCFRCSATAFECDPPQRLASLELVTMSTMIAKNFNDRRQTTSRS